MLKPSINTAFILHIMVMLITMPLFIAGCATTQDHETESTTNLSAADKNNYQLAISRLKSGEMQQAEIILKKMVRKNPGLVNAYINLGIISLKNDHLDQAENYLTQALKDSPENIYALNQMGIVQRQKGNFTRARELYTKALSIEPDYALAHLNLGILYDLYFYDLTGAIKHYKKYQELTKGSDKNVAKWIIDIEHQLNKTVASK